MYNTNIDHLVANVYFDIVSFLPSFDIPLLTIHQNPYFALLYWHLLVIIANFLYHLHIPNKKVFH